MFVVPPPAPPKFEPKQLVEGMEWIALAVQAHGGHDFLDPGKALRFVRETEVDGWQVEAERWMASDLSLLTSTTWTSADGEVERTTWGLTDAEAWFDDGSSVLAVTSPHQRHDLRRVTLREPLAILLARTRPDFRAAHLGSGTLGEQPVADVLVEVAGLVTLLHLDQGTGEILGLSWTGRLDDGRTREVTEMVADWQELDGKRVPIRRVVTTRDGAGSEVAHTRVELVEEIPEGLFEPPR